jgi:hypothetical protein
VSDLEVIRGNAALAVEKLAPLTDFPFGFDRQSVAWVEDFIGRQQLRPDFSPEALGAMPDVLGCFLGEAIVLQTGGRWDDDEVRGWTVVLADGSALFPLNKVYKRLVGGPEDSILSFYDIAVDFIATGRFAAARDGDRAPRPGC